MRVHSTTTWDSIGQPLAGHTLTITRIAFSPDDSRILTVSRDRGWRVFRKDTDAQGFVPESKDERAHSRMVLDAAWGDDFFVTASRDKSVSLIGESSFIVADVVRSKSGNKVMRLGQQSQPSSSIKLQQPLLLLLGATSLSWPSVPREAL